MSAFKEHEHENVNNKILKNYQIKHKLGQGTSAIVYSALQIDSKQQVAIKAIPKMYLNSDPKLMQLIKTQISILKSCSNTNIIKCLDVFHSIQSVFIVTQFCNQSDLQGFMRQRKYLSEDHAVTFLKQILNGFKGLHQLGVMHRDFKLENILMHDNVCKIADLGYAKRLHEEEKTYTFLGTIITMAPEVIERNGYNISADIWSLGAVFYHLLYGQYPYVGKNDKDYIKKVRTKSVDFSKKRISREAQNFIERCLTYNPTKRIKWAQIYQHPLICKKQMQILYGIFNPKHYLQENKQFYHFNQKQLNPQVFERFQEMPLMRDSSIKKKTIEEIQHIFASKIQTIGGPKINIGQKQQNVLLQYANQYIAYFNKLSYPLKFLRLDLLDQIEDSYQQIIDKESFVYLISKKSYFQLKQFLKIINGKVNIFKIAQKWREFVKSRQYNQMKQTVQFSIKKAEQIVKILQQCAAISNIDEIRQQACSEKSNFKLITLLCEKYLKPMANVLLEKLKNSEHQNIDFLHFMEGLCYYLVADQWGNMSPEQLDKKLAENNHYIGALVDLVERYELLFNYQQ